MPNITFHDGKRRPKHAASLQLARWLRGAAIDYPPSEDYAKISAPYPMYLNDTFGTCVAATAGDIIHAATELAGSPMVPTDGQVIDFYRTQNPGFQPNPNNPVEDNGMDVQTSLDYLRKFGWPGTGKKLLAFASVPITKMYLQAAMGIFGWVQIGFRVQAANMDQFNSGNVWDYVPGSQILGGHSVMGGGYLNQPMADIRFVTWAEETTFTDAMLQLIDEAWVWVLDETLGMESFQQGLDFSVMAADYKQITGQDFPAPLPVPPPTPTPTPVPVDNQFLIDLLNKILLVKGLPKWVRLVIKTVLQELGG